MILIGGNKIMKLKHYIFLTSEGMTFTPNSESVEPDIENLQVIGLASGINSKTALKKLLKDNRYLRNTGFGNVFSYELAPAYDISCTYHTL
jgi:hypothetical protein